MGDEHRESHSAEMMQVVFTVVIIVIVIIIVYDTTAEGTSLTLQLKSRAVGFVDLPPSIIASSTM